MYLVLEKDVCFPEKLVLERIFEIQRVFKIARSSRKIGTRAIFGKEEKFFKMARGL